MQYRTLGSGYTHQYCTAGLYGTRFSVRNPIPLPSTRQYLYTLHAQALPSFCPFAFIDPFKFNFSLIYCLSSFFVQIFPFSLPPFHVYPPPKCFFQKIHHCSVMSPKYLHLFEEVIKTRPLSEPFHSPQRTTGTGCLQSENI